MGRVMEELAKIVELCAQGKMKILVDRVFPLEEAAAAHPTWRIGSNSGSWSWYPNWSAGQAHSLLPTAFQVSHHPAIAKGSLK